MSDIVITKKIRSGSDFKTPHGHRSQVSFSGKPFL